MKQPQLLISRLLFICLVSAFAFGQTSSPDTRKTSTPYTGDLSIFDSPGREDRLQINRVMDLLGISGGKNVADIGAGSGWFTVRAAKRVGAEGIVYAVDINPEAIQYIQNRAKKEGKILGRPKIVIDRETVRELYKAGNSVRTIAAEMGLTKSTVFNIVNAN